jgi:2,5-furandicarboxylate decarboxylase 1
VPAWAEIVIEGEILAGAREKEGPFGEFTGYLTGRSTDHVFVAKALCLRERPWFQSISGGRTPDHVLPLAVLREAEIRNAVSRVIPTVRAVHVPVSGCAAFVAFVSIKQVRPGEAKHAIPVILGADHYLKLVVVVDDDIDVFNEAEIIWALATRVQADRDLVIISGRVGGRSLDDRRGGDREARHRRHPALRPAVRRAARHEPREDGVGARPGGSPGDVGPGQVLP